LADHRRYPGCRLLLFCGACTWSKSYRPERIIARLQELRVSGHTTPVTDVAKRVGWNCPSCGRMRWGSQLVYPAELDEREARRLVRQIRS